MADGSSQRREPFVCDEADEDGYGKCRLCDYFDRLRDGLCVDCEDAAEVEDTSWSSMRRELGTWG